MKSDIVICDSCGKSTTTDDGIPEESDSWWCMSCVEKWEIQSGCHFEDGTWHEKFIAQEIQKRIQALIGQLDVNQVNAVQRSLHQYERYVFSLCAAGECVNAALRVEAVLSGIAKIEDKK